MNRVVKFWKIIIFDSLGILFMVAALLTGWLPGPGGVPLFLIGLSLLAINHEWAKRYIDLLKKYANRLGDLVFVKNAKVRLIYDIVAPVLLALGVYLLVRHSALWMISIGVFLACIGATLLLGNRNRWQKLKNKFKQSS